MKNKIAEKYHSVLSKIHKRVGIVDTDYKMDDYIDDMELYYSFCVFFSYSEKTLIGLFNVDYFAVYKEIKKYAEEKFAMELHNNASDYSQMKQLLDDKFFEVQENCDGRESSTAEEKYFFNMFEVEGILEEMEDKPSAAIMYFEPLIDTLAHRLANRPGFVDMCENIIEARKSAERLIIETEDRLKQSLKDSIKGQDMAIDKFVDSYIRYKLHGGKQDKPAVVSLFAGPPGTGKTYLAESFVELLKDQGYKYKRFDMSAFGGQSGDNVSGLVGFDATWKNSQPGQLTDFVKNNPKCVLLFDEIEKAAPQVRMIFLSVLEGATLIDRYYDEQVSFKDAIIIFTTNEGKELYEDNYDTNLTAISDLAVMEGLKNSNFPPELLSRFAAGNIIVFNHLAYENMIEIFNSNLKSSINGIMQSSTKLQIEYDENLLPKLFLYNKGGYVDARFVSSNTRKYVEDYYLRAVKYVLSKSKSSYGRVNLNKICVTVDVDENMEEFFSLSKKPRILWFSKSKRAPYTKAISALADIDWVDDISSFEQAIEECNWNNWYEKYNVVLISLFGASETEKSYLKTEGYRCLLYAKEKRLAAPIMLENNISKGKKRQLSQEEKKAFRLYEVKDFIDLQTNQLEEALIRCDFVEKVRIMSKDGEKLSAEAKFDYNAKTGCMNICFTNICISSALEELAEARRMNKQYLLDKKPQVRLKAVFGNKLAKEAVRRCIDNIKYPEKYLRVGAKLIKGILMYGAPGMGKTMIAKAMAYESGAAFVSAVGSDFVREGGIVRLEEIFATARRKKPCIIFIDEIDAIAKVRGHISNIEEMVQNKLLKEMDGLEIDNEGVYVVGATNYNLESLDPAVTRRFSSKIEFPYPNKGECLEFLAYTLYRKGLNKYISPRVVKTLNLMMYGHMTNYSEIENFIEESIAEAVYRGVPVTEKYLINRVHDVTGGAARGVGNITRLTATAFHEAGHAVLQWYYGRNNEYATVVSRGNYGGYAMANSKLYSRKDFLEQIRISFAGRMTEILFYKLDENLDNEEAINLGAQSDLKKATNLAYDFVTRLGFGKRYPVVPDRFVSRQNPCPEDILPESEKKAIWEEVNEILKEQWEITKQDIKLHWKKVNAVATSLLFMKELDGETIEHIINTEIPVVDESCFDSDSIDYATINDKNDKGEDVTVNCPYGYPIYPRSMVREMPENEASETTPKTYYYAVKGSKESYGIFQDLNQAFALAYTESASCRRFQNKHTAQEYLDNLELRISRFSGKEKIGFVVDALDVLREGDFDNPQLRIIGSKNVIELREEAAERGLTLEEYFVNVVVKGCFTDNTEEFDLVFQIYDEELKSMIINKWD